jgi:hypothetical protein
MSEVATIFADTCQHSDGVACGAVVADADGEVARSRKKSYRAVELSCLLVARANVAERCGLTRGIAERDGKVKARSPQP